MFMFHVTIQVVGPGVRFIADIAAIHVDSLTFESKMKGGNSVIGFYISVNQNNSSVDLSFYL